jgi:DNA-binding transcriptional LysR family regulator
MAQSFDWDAIQSFLAVARAGRLTLAARRLGVDHSTLSRRISGLESTLGTRLFERQTSGYALTEQGEHLLEQAQQMESIAFRIVDELSDTKLQVAGTVRIGAPDGFGTSFLASRLGKLTAAHRELTVQLVSNPRTFSLSKREADIAISLARPQAGRLHVRKLTDYRLGLYASPGYLADCPPLRTVRDLRAHRFVGYIEELIYAPELDYLPMLSPEIHPRLTSSNLVAQLHATREGAVLCVLPCFMVADETDLVRVLPDSVELIRAYWLLVHADLRELARIRIAADFIAAEVQAARSLFLPQRTGAPPLTLT